MSRLPTILPFNPPSLQFLKAIRLRVEMHWSALYRARACECDADVEAGCGQSTKHLPMGMGNKSMATVTPPIPPPKACCGGGAAAAGGDSSSSTDEPVPTSSKRKYWLRRGGFGARDGALVVGGRQLMTRWQVRALLCQGGAFGGRLATRTVQLGRECIAGTVIRHARLRDPPLCLRPGACARPKRACCPWVAVLCCCIL